MSSAYGCFPESNFGWTLWRLYVFMSLYFIGETLSLSRTGVMVRWTWNSHHATASFASLNLARSSTGQRGVIAASSAHTGTRKAAKLVFIRMGMVSGFDWFYQANSTLSPFSDHGQTNQKISAPGLTTHRIWWSMHPFRSFLTYSQESRNILIVMF